MERTEAKVLRGRWCASRMRIIITNMRERAARIIREPADHPFGERQYTVEDFGGHEWTFSQTIADVAPEERGGESGQL